MAEEIKDRGGPALVAGDLNDVAWSRTTTLFQQISGLLDPRKGRGLFNTYNAMNPLTRWPLDHVFFSEHFTLVTMRRLDAIGSDHFPILVEVAFDPSATAAEKPDEPDAEARELAERRVREARDSNDSGEQVDSGN